MVTGSRVEGGAQVLSAGVRRTIQSIKEIVGNHSDADIYVALKETNMDPNETTQRLLNQGPLSRFCIHFFPPLFLTSAFLDYWGFLKWKLAFLTGLRKCYLINDGVTLRWNANKIGTGVLESSVSDGVHGFSFIFLFKKHGMQ